MSYPRFPRPRGWLGCPKECPSRSLPLVTHWSSMPSDLRFSGGGDGNRTHEPLACHASALPTELRPQKACISLAAGSAAPGLAAVPPVGRAAGDPRTPAGPPRRVRDQAADYILAAWHSRAGRPKPWSSTRASRPTTRRSTGPTTRTPTPPRCTPPWRLSWPTSPTSSGRAGSFAPTGTSGSAPTSRPTRRRSRPTIGPGYVQLSADGLVCRSGPCTTWPPISWIATGGPWLPIGTGTALEQTITGLTDAGDRRARHRRPQDGAQGLPQGSSPD